MPINLKVEVTGDGAVKDKLFHLRAVAKRPRSLMARLGAEVFRWSQQQFIQQGALEGGWAPLAASTQKRRGGGAMILRDTGQLMASFTLRVSDLGAAVGTNLPFARFHQDGGKHLPRRPMLPSTIAVIFDKLKRIADEWASSVAQKGKDPD